MAAEFDSSGFSAVDKFFGGGGTEREETKKVTTTAGNRGKRRGGVGASTKSSDTKTLSSDLLAKQVLTVGRKRSRDDSVEDEYDGVDDHGVHDADEADGGRTSIAPKKASSKTFDKPQTSKPSKKLGRKERERQKQAAKAGGDVNQKQEHPPPSNNTETTETAEGADVVNRNNDPSHPKPKKKRRKVRSRQKNIRKDNRSADEKPAHLIPGNRNYKGRPMTQATREKLNLPSPVKKPFRSKWNNDEKADDLFVIDRDPDSAGDDLGVKLAIDELMGSDDKGDAEKSISIDDEKPKKNEKKKSSKKKKKFKNL